MATIKRRLKAQVGDDPKGRFPLTQAMLRTMRGIEHAGQVWVLSPSALPGTQTIYLRRDPRRLLTTEFERVGGIQTIDALLMRQLIRQVWAGPGITAYELVPDWENRLRRFKTRG